MHIKLFCEFSRLWSKCVLHLQQKTKIPNRDAIDVKLQFGWHVYTHVNQQFMKISKLIALMKINHFHLHLYANSRSFMTLNVERRKKKPV